MLQPINPSTLCFHQAPIISFIGPFPPLESGKVSSLQADEADVDDPLTFEEDDTSSAESSSSGTYQSAVDEEEEVLDAVLLPQVNQGTNWMVAKRQAFALKESRQSRASTPQLQAELRLLKLLNKHNAPLQLFPAFQEWARDSTKLKHDFSRRVYPRSRVLLELEDRFDMRDARFTPKIIVSYLPDKRANVVYVASFAATVYSLLSGKDLMIEDNLSFPYADNLFTLKTPAEPGHCPRRKPDLSELHYGTWHRATHIARCTGPNDLLLAPVIGYMDGVATDAFGRLGLCPFNFTLGIINAATRT